MLGELVLTMVAKVGTKEGVEILFQGLEDQDLLGGLEGRSNRVISWAIVDY